MRLLLLAVLAAAAATDAATPRSLERRIDELAKAQAALPKPSLADVMEAGSLADSVPDSAAARQAWDKVRRILEERHKAEVPLVLQMTVAARRLQVYRRTGRIPAANEVADVGDLKRFLDDPWGQKTGRVVDPDCEVLEHCRQAPRLELSLPALMKQIEEYAPARPDLVARRAPKSRDSGKVARVQPPSGPPSAAHAAPRPSAPLLRDSVPTLVAMLASPDARRRALAADMLGSLGTDAAPAVAQLRHALLDRDARVRASAATALGDIAIATPEVLQDLERSLQDASEDVRLSSRAALGRLAARGREAQKSRYLTQPRRYLNSD